METKRDHDHHHDHDHDHDHHHDHDHGHHHDHHHAHGVGHNHLPEDASDLRIALTVILNVVLTVAQLVIGFFAGSVALIADALHNTADAVALIIAFVARKVGRRPADLRFTFGYQRVELVAAMINLTSLVVLSGFLAKESITRLLNPEPVLAGWVMLAAGVALVIDVATVVLLLSSAKESLNVRAALLHNLSDAATSLAVLAGAAAMYWGVGSWIDPLLGLLIATYILVSAIMMLRRVAAVLMNNSPPGVDVEALQASLLGHAGVCGVHHLHVWQLDEHRNAISVHVVLNEDLNVSSTAAITEELRDAIRGFDVDHITLQLEAPGAECGDQKC